MRLIEKALIAKWEDGSIPKGAKTELITKFQKHFGFTQKSSVFTSLMAERSQPTPDQHQFLSDGINAYWDFYNPSAAESSAQTSEKIKTEVD